MTQYALTHENRESDGQPYARIWGKGESGYGQKLIKAFPDASIVAPEPISGTSERYDWYLRIDRPPDALIAGIESCLQLFVRTLCIKTLLQECFALAWHSQPGRQGKHQLTIVGDWVHMAKSYYLGAEGAGNPVVAGLIAEQMVEFVRRHPLYRSCDGLVAALPSNPEKTYDLPQALAAALSEDVAIPFLSSALRKVRPTAQMKACPTMADKLDNIGGSIEAQAALVRGRRLILVDDILESGATLEETAGALRRGGAMEVHGLVATKTLKRSFS